MDLTKDTRVSAVYRIKLRYVKENHAMDKPRVTLQTNPMSRAWCVVVRHPVTRVTAVVSVHVAV